ncbi:MAG: hypothetical protein ABW173_01445 [Sphingomonas sp.]
MPRRIVAANDAAGRSHILLGEAVTDAERWRTGGEAPLGSPPAGGSRATFVTPPPRADMRTVVTPGDIVIQRDASHAWCNHGVAPAAFRGVMVSAVPAARA